MLFRSHAAHKKARALTKEGKRNMVTDVTLVERSDVPKPMVIKPTASNKPALPRTRDKYPPLQFGTLVRFRGVGWILTDNASEVYLSPEDIPKEGLAIGDRVEFTLYENGQGRGAENVWKVEGMSLSPISRRVTE